MGAEIKKFLEGLIAVLDIVLCLDSWSKHAIGCYQLSLWC